MKLASTMMVAGAVLLGAVAWNCLGEGQTPAKKKLLFYSQSFGFRHSEVCRPLTGEVSNAERRLKEWAAQAGWELDLSQDFHDVTADTLKKYDAVILYTSGDPLIDKQALFNWLRSGKALIGIHSATDTFKEDPEYVKVIGGSFSTHGAGDKKVTIKIEQSDTPMTKMLPKEWEIVDEIYQHKEGSFSRDNMTVLMSVDTAKTDLAPQNMTLGKDYPIAWTRQEGKGRVFYTALGHREDVWTNPLYQQHLMGGIGWALEAAGK